MARPHPAYILGNNAFMLGWKEYFQLDCVFVLESFESITSIKPLYFGWTKNAVAVSQ